MIAGGQLGPATLETLIGLQEEAAERVPKAPPLTPMETSDRGGRHRRLAGRHGVRDGWDIAPTFVAAGLDVAWLDRVEATVDPGSLEGALRWLNYTVETELLMNEIEDSTTRISTLVGAAKQYSQLDRAPYQVVDVHELLDSTLMMLSGKMPPGIRVVKEYDRSLPQIPAYAAELNQVWTNLIDNAVSAMDGPGTLTVRTGMDREDGCSWRSATPGPGSRRRSGTGSSSRSSPPSRSARDRAGPGHLLAHRGEQAPRGPVTAVVARGHAVPGAAADDLKTEES